MKNNQLLQNKEKIIAWLNQYQIKDYEVVEDNEYGYVVNVEGGVDISNKNLKLIAVKFNEVKGNFNCAKNQLATLEGGPKEVGGYFGCANNQLVSLEGCPKKVGGFFFCPYNQLTTLDGAPKEIGGSFNCRNNQLVSLEGCPKEVSGDFYCQNNQLASLELENLPGIIGGVVNLNNNPILGQIQEIANFNELKNFLIIQEEEKLLQSIIECKKMHLNIFKI